MSMGTRCRIKKTSLRTMWRSLCRGGACAGAVLALASSAQAQYNLLHQFGSTHSDGEEPFGDLTLSGSTLYGMTYYGGTNGVEHGGYGVIFQISTNGTGYTILHQFGSIPGDGWNHEGSLILSGSTLYGMTYGGGTNDLEDGGDGVIFSLSFPLQITSITQTSNSIAISWTTGGAGSTNELQATAGTANGSYATNNFATIFAVTNILGSATNYTDMGGATNTPARYYRVRSP